MTDIIEHRGPDGNGYYMDNCVGLGHRRLAIIDLSEDGHQPFIDGNLVLVFNGEIYNYIELREELLEQGVTFRTQTDTEVLLKAYQYWGEECLHRFNGMWAFVIYDTVKKTVFASRDRFGIKPLYYYLDEEDIILASEIKQIHRVKKLSVNKPILFDFLEDGYLNHTSETLFEEVMEVQKGHNFLYNVDTSDFTTYQYYNLESITSEELNISYNKACEEFYSLFQSSVQLRLRSDVKVGVSLSGGLDSTSISAMMTQSLNSVPTFSVCFDNDIKSERKYIDAAVEMYKYPNISLQPTFQDFLDHVESTIWHMDQPISSTSFVMDHILLKNQSANNIVVTLSGQGADEILAGYTSFKGIRLKELLNNRRYLSFLSIASKIVLDIPDRISARIRSKLDKENRIIAAKLPFTKKNFSESTVRELSLRYMESVGLGLLLHYVDRNSMAASIESRVPFLDHRLVEFCLRLPSDFKIDNTITKRTLRDALSTILPDIIRYRKDKLGYHTPQKIWFSDNLRVIMERIKSSSIMKVLNNDFIEKMKSPVSEMDAAALTRLFSAVIWLELFELELD